MTKNKMKKLIKELDVFESKCAKLMKQKRFAEALDVGVDIGYTEYVLGIKK